MKAALIDGYRKGDAVRIAEIPVLNVCGNLSDEPGGRGGNPSIRFALRPPRSRYFDVAASCVVGNAGGCSGPFTMA